MDSNGIVLVLGSGAARGLSHIGVIEVLEKHEIPIRAIIGSSIGAEIGALYAAGVGIKEMKRLACDLDWKTTLRLFSPDFGRAGMSTGKGIREYLTPYLDGLKIEELPITFAATATDLETGGEVVLQSGDLIDAVRASISLPGLLSPVRLEGKALVDGALVNPVPFDTARHLFGGPVVAVAVHPGTFPQEFANGKPEPEWTERLQDLIDHPWIEPFPYIQEWLRGFKQAAISDDKPAEIGISDVFMRAISISRAEIMRLRQRLDPPEILLKPRVQDIYMLEFYRAGEAIEAGYRECEVHLDTLKKLIE